MDPGAPVGVARTAPWLDAGGLPGRTEPLDADALVLHARLREISVAASENPDEPHTKTVVSAPMDAGRSATVSRPGGRGQPSGVLRV